MAPDCGVRWGVVSAAPGPTAVLPSAWRGTPQRAAAPGETVGALGAALGAGTPAERSTDSEMSCITEDAAKVVTAFSQWCAGGSFL